IQEILRAEGTTNDETLFPLIELLEPSKTEVLNWSQSEPLTRKASVQYTSKEGFREAIVDISNGTVENDGPIGETGQPMVLFAEFIGALEGALGDERMVSALAKRELKPTDVFCLPLTAGNFFDGTGQSKRLMKVPCYVAPSQSNFYAKPIEGLFAVYDLKTSEVIDVEDTGIVPINTDPWGYTEEEVAERQQLRPAENRAKITQEGEPNFKFNDSQLTWDIWKLRYRTEKRAGIVISDIQVKDQETWRPVIYQTYLSEVFVPYMDPDKGWYWRTYMDSGEYGFGLFLSPLTAGVDCPEYATFLPAVINDDAGKALEIPNAICIFERATGDPAWRHFEVFAQTEDNFVPAEGRPYTELVVRTASEVGNYDYLVDYRFQRDGQMRIMIGATGLDAVKGVAATSTNSDTYKEDTSYGTLIAPNLVAPNHDHYFNFRIDFDIDQPNNQFMTMDIVPNKDIGANNPRRSMWKVQHNMPASEMAARYKVSASAPRYYHVANPAREGYLGHAPGWMIHHGSIAYGPYDFENDPPFKRNPYIEYSVWNTVYDPEQRYAGGKFAFQSDGTDNLLTFVQDDQALQGQDIVTWFTAGFHHIPRMEDWPVMSTEWKQIHIMPHNYFAYNPALTLRK
ncbi:MAG: tyramine oxidase, partial [Pseudomonadota bacterium]